MSKDERTTSDEFDARWTEHLCRAVDAFAREMRGVVPEDFSRHARGSLREALMAVRSLIDTGIENLEAEKKTKKARKVKVE